MEIFWTIIGVGGIGAFFAWCLYKAFIQVPPTYLSKDGPLLKEILSEYQEQQELAKAHRELEVALGDDYADVIGDFGDLLVKMHEEDKEQTLKQYPMLRYPIELLPHDKARIAEILDYLIIHGNSLISEDMLKISRMNLDSFTDDEELFKEQQDFIETLNWIEQQEKKE